MERRLAITYIVSATTTFGVACVTIAVTSGGLFVSAAPRPASGKQIEIIDDYIVVQSPTTSVVLSDTLPMPVDPAAPAAAAAQSELNRPKSPAATATPTVPSAATAPAATQTAVPTAEPVTSPSPDPTPVPPPAEAPAPAPVPVQEPTPATPPTQARAAARDDDAPHHSGGDPATDP